MASSRTLLLLIGLLAFALSVSGAKHHPKKPHKKQHVVKRSPSPTHAPHVVVGSTSSSYTSLSTCQAVAAKFWNTCTSTCTSTSSCPSVSSMTGSTVSCSSWKKANTCPTTLSGTKCSWTAKLCVSCYTSGGVTKMRVQSNGLPPRCAWPGRVGMVSNEYDWEFNFNPTVSGSSLNYSPTTQAAVNATVCNVARHKTVPTASGFVNYGTTTGMNAVAAMAVDGIIMMNPNDADSVDPFFPPAGETVWQSESVDTCLNHPQSASLYHYHTMSPCMVTKPTGSVLLCNTSTSCASDKASYMLSTFTASAKTLTVIGIGKDGHVVYGPYESSGSLVTGLDVCNGKFDTSGAYAYYATTTYPYFSGCFGPGNSPSYVPACTTNPPKLGTTWSG